MKELYAAEETERKKINHLISSIQKEEKDIADCQTTLDKIKHHASDLQTFLALNHIQLDISNNEKFLETLIKEEKMNHVSISWKNETSVEKLLTTMKKMGTIILETKAGDAALTIRKNKQSQIMLPIIPVPSINDIKLTLNQTVKTNGDESQTLFATSGYHHDCIKIINMKNRKTEKSIVVGSEIYEIVHKDGKFFYNGCRRGLFVVSLDDDYEVQLVNLTLKRFSSIPIWSDKLYFIGDDDSITCSDPQGGSEWKLEQKTLFSNPRGIAVDNYGCVYVSDLVYGSYNFVVISPDGSKHRVLLSEKDDLKKPQSVFYNRKNNKLHIANQRNEAFLYDVSKRIDTLFLSMSSSLTVCGVCDYRNIRQLSVFWCSECDEGLCEGCKDHHAASKGTRDHGIVLISELQENLIKELYDVEEKENKSITNIISSIEEKEREVTESQTNLDKVKQHASDLQTFLAMKHIQRDVTINEQFLESLIKEEKINNTSIS
ncbi:unnamed protein product [Mytilus edulis]|uniref:B box-type domain-containing protein n=2 Tax=Mytilus edulis TaxID=6550 RepID=A0A8S3RF40_MYTED|nr:unnamed protein product [Mytilus edulis]